MQYLRWCLIYYMVLTNLYVRQPAPCFTGLIYMCLCVIELCSISSGFSGGMQKRQMSSSQQNPTNNSIVTATSLQSRQADLKMFCLVCYAPQSCSSLRNTGHDEDVDQSPESCHNSRGSIFRALGPAFACKIVLPYRNCSTFFPTDNPC